MRFFCGFIIGCALMTCFQVSADLISAPPPLNKNTPSGYESVLYLYLREIYENFHKLPVVTSNPDGTRTGKRGEMVFLQTGGTNYLQINTDSLTQWRGISLSDTP